MSNVRKPGAAAVSYRQGYLRSPAWKARRARWFRENPRGHRCVVCGRPAAERELELHHVAYRGIERRVLADGRVIWSGWEPDEDLWPMHPFCHAAIHRLIDQDHVLGHMRSRRAATERAIAIVRHRLAKLIRASGLEAG